mgnify:CR=1 FL=1
MSIQITSGAAGAPAASATVAGIVELATTTEAATGTDTVRAVTPAGLALRKIGDGWALGSGGNARGLDAVDLQTARNAPTQVAFGSQATIGGGQSNTASGAYATIGGGSSNNATGVKATIGGGLQNAASGNQATVGGGYQNTASGDYSTVGGGSSNNATGVKATIGGGLQNAASGDYSTVGGGKNNTASGANSAILGGITNNTNALANAMIVGSNITASLANALHCNRLVITQIPVASAGLPSGAIWSNGGTLKVVP